MRATRGRRKCLNAFLFRVKAHQKLSAACASATLGDAELARARPAAVRRTCFVLLDRVLREVDDSTRGPARRDRVGVGLT